MKKNCVLLLCLSIPLIAKEEQKSSEITKLTAQDLNQHATTWVKELPKLTQDELSLLANLLYFDFLSTWFERAARFALISIHNQSIIMNKQLVQNETEATKTALNNAKQLKELKEELLPMRKYALLSLQTCLKEIEKSGYNTLKEIVVNMQQYSKMAIAQFIKQDKPSIEKIIQNGKDALTTHLEKLNSYKDILGAVLDHKNPYIKEGDNPDTVDFDVAIAASDATLASLNEITLSATVIKMLSIDVLGISSLISKNFYNALYDSLPTSKKSALPIMFDKNGLISLDNRDEYLVELDDDLHISKKHYA